MKARSNIVFILLGCVAVACLAAGCTSELIGPELIGPHGPDSSSEQITPDGSPRADPRIPPDGSLRQDAFALDRSPDTAPRDASQPMDSNPPVTCPSVGPDTGGASGVPTFHSLGLYWSPTGGAAGRGVTVEYRKAETCTWFNGLSMKYNPISGTDKDKGDYRGSLVNLSPNTAYAVRLTLEGTQTQSVLTIRTWNEVFPIGKTTKARAQNSTLEVNTSGTATAYHLYDGTGVTIDVANNHSSTIHINASYVIVRGFTVKGARQSGILITGGHDIIIEDCDISGWGESRSNGFGSDTHGAIYSWSTSLERLVVQRNKMHHPRADSNSWAEYNEGYHPNGPQCITLYESSGNHVLRYNECYSDADHYLNDGFGAGANDSYNGFPGPDSDIYGNYVANCWDDGLELEGGGRNVRAWNNYVDEAYLPYANAAVSIGPFYFWRNVSGRSYSPPNSLYGQSASFMKMGYAGSEDWMTGHMYLFHNTVLQPKGEGAGGLGTIGTNDRIVKHLISRNNVLHVQSGTTRCIGDNRNLDNDLDYDLCSAAFPSGYGSHGIKGIPSYETGPTFDVSTRVGSFTLAKGSLGHDAGEKIPNFSDGYGGTAPDMGAHENGSSPMEYGVKARFMPPQPRP